MGIIDVTVISIALAMDALGVTISLGVNPKLKRNNKIKFILSFAIFQFLFVFCGSVSGYYFDTYIATIPQLLGGIVIAIVGGIMVIEGFRGEDGDSKLILKRGIYILLGISVSIDALVIGFTIFHQLSTTLLMILDSVMVGLICLLICTLGFFMCRYIRKIDFICKYADYLGGIILILFGLRMIFL